MNIHTKRQAIIQTIITFSTNTQLPSFDFITSPESPFIPRGPGAPLSPFVPLYPLIPRGPLSPRTPCEPLGPAGPEK